MIFFWGIKKSLTSFPCQKKSHGLVFSFSSYPQLESSYFLQSSICLVNGSSAGSKFSFFVSSQFQFYDFLDAVLARLQERYRYRCLIHRRLLPDILNKESDLLLVVDDIAQLRRICRTRSIPCRDTQQLSQCSTAYHGRSDLPLRSVFFAQRCAYRLSPINSQTSQQDHGECPHDHR